MGGGGGGVEECVSMGGGGRVEVEWVCAWEALQRSSSHIIQGTTPWSLLLPSICPESKYYSHLKSLYHCTPLMLVPLYPTDACTIVPH